MNDGLGSVMDRTGEQQLVGSCSGAFLQREIKKAGNISLQAFFNANRINEGRCLAHISNLPVEPQVFSGGISAHSAVYTIDLQKLFLSAP
jgi:hypothetical protein